MKECPYCKAKLEDAAATCGRCGAPVAGAERRVGREEWFFRPSFIVFGFLCVGPLVLPLVWLRPRASRRWKIVVTAIGTAVSVALFFVFIKSQAVLKEYYSLMEGF